MSKFALGLLLASTSALTAGTNTWQGTGTSNDMHVPGNWSNGLPMSSDDVIFDSSKPNIATNPFEASTNFSIHSFQFPNQASPFTISFDNYALQFNGSAGITGTQTNARINGTNTNNSTFLSIPQISFNGGSAGSAIINMSNTATQTANVSGTTLGSVNGQFYSSAAFSMGNGASLTLTNSGIDSTTGTGNNSTSPIGTSQAEWDDTLTVGNNVALSISNSATFNGMNSSAGSGVGVVNGYQFNSSGAFLSGDNFNLTVSNSGNNSSSVYGLDNVGVINSHQANFGDTCQVGNNATFLVSNYGNNSGNGTHTSNVGYLNDYQLSFSDTYLAGDNLAITVTNTGNDSSSDQGGTYTANINSGGGGTGSQLAFLDTCTVGKNANISVQMNATCSGAKASAVNVCSFNQDQMIFVKDFNADNFLKLTATNSGMDSSTFGGTSTNVVGAVSYTQIEFQRDCTILDNATIILSNSGNSSANNQSSSYDNCGTAVGQLLVLGDFQAGHSLLLQVENSGTNTGSGNGGNYIGTLTNAPQAEFAGTCTVGNDAAILISNSGTNSGSSTGNVVGSMNNNRQMTVGGAFVAGTNLNLSISNAANNTGDPSNYVGFVNGDQVFIGDTLTMGDGSLFSVSNTGLVGQVQIYLNNGFTITSGKATIQAINQGTVDNNGIYIQGSNLGGNANIILEGNDLFVNTTGASFTIGELNGDITSSAISNVALIIDTDSSTKGNFSGVISSATSLTKQGPGQQTLSGANTYTGLTTVQNGILAINGLVTGDVDVTGGSLKGTGTVGGTVTIEAGGTVAPGNSIGPMTYGSLILNPGANTSIEIDATDASRLNVVGSAVINGTLIVVPDVDAYPHEGTYLIVSAGSLSGDFSSIINPPGFTFNVSVVDNDIYLNYLLGIDTKGLRGNSLKVADYLNTYAPPSIEFTTLAGLTGSTLSRAMESLSPARNAFSTYINEQFAFSLSSFIMEHMDSLRLTEPFLSQKSRFGSLYADASNRFQKPVKCECEEPRNQFSNWVAVFGDFAHQKAELQNPAFHFNSGAFLAGFDYEFRDEGLIGGALGYAATKYHENRHAGNGNINHYFFSLYGSAFAGDFYISPAFWGIYNNTHNTRNISYPGFSEKAYSSIYAWQFLPHLEVGYDAEFCWGDVIPFSVVDWAIIWQRHYSEHGASPYNAKQKARRASMVRSETGLKVCEKWDYCWGYLLLTEKASYVFEKPFGVGTVNAAFVGTPSSFTVTAVNQNLNLGAIGVHLQAVIGDDTPVKLELGYEGEFGAKYWSNDIQLTFSKVF